MNFNSISGFNGGTGRNQIGLQTLAATTETAFTVNTDSGTPTTAFLAVPAGGGIAGSGNPLNPDANASKLQQNSSLTIPRGIARPEFNSTSFSGRPFRLRIYGTGNAGVHASNTTIIKLRQGTSATVASNNLVFTGPTWDASAGGAFNFFIQFTFLWDSTSTLLSGFADSNFGFSTGTYTANAKTTVTTVASLAVMQFSATTTWGDATGGTVQVNEFTMERL